MRNQLCLSVLLVASAGCAGSDPVVTTRPGAVATTGATTPAVAAPPVVVADEPQLAARVIDALTVPTEAVSVRVDGHTAYLAGSVASLGARQRARTDALTVDGIFRVDTRDLVVR